ncbi:MAG: PEGA domain-containing protein [Deltaproteobacteria bacterium]|nr:PEGA domain-containing protein [Deltaproteobacteria bacterium]
MKLAYLARRAAAFVAAALLLVLTVGRADAATCPLAKAGSKYKVRIDSAPPGATVYIDNEQCGAVGVTPWAGSLVNGDYTIILKLDGYEVKQEAFKVVRSRKEQAKFIPLVKKADPPRIDIRADADKNLFGAQVFLDGQLQGTAPLIVTTEPGRHLIEIKKEGFEPYQQWVETKLNNNESLAPTIKEIAKPKLGTIVVEADVRDAEVWIDGNKLPSTTPTVIPNVVEGLHVIEVRKDPAIPWKQTVQVVADQQVKVSAGLKATLGGQGGSIQVLSNISGAHVFLDGSDMGPVPVDIKDAKPGEHIIEVKAPGYQNREEKVTVNAGSAAILKLDLNPVAPKDIGTIKVVSPVANADVIIDGGLVGKVPQEKSLAAGEHFVTVQLDGYKKFEIKVRLEAGQTQTVSAELKAVGRVQVLSTPPNAKVLINGIPVGTTPADLKELEVGQPVLQLELDGYEQFTQTLTVVGGKTAVIQATMQKLGASPEEQRGLSSFGARTLPRGHSTIDIGVGYPYFLEGKVSVGAGKIAKKYGFDANVGARTMLARSELGLGVRGMLVDADPFSAGLFTDLWFGSKLFDDSKRDGLTFNVGAVASLTAISHVTISGRLYLNAWSDRHCPTLKADGTFDGSPIAACKHYNDVAINGAGDAETAKIEELTGLKGKDMFGREGGVRMMASAIAEIAVKQQWNLFVLLEFAPFQSERALFTDEFTSPMLSSDYHTYLRVGSTFKF